MSTNPHRSSRGVPAAARSMAGGRSFGRRNRSRRFQPSLAGSFIFRRRPENLGEEGIGRATGDGTSGFVYQDPLFDNGYDPLRLLDNTEAVMSSVIYLKKGGFKAVGSGWDKYVAQLRGSTVVLFDHGAQAGLAAGQHPPIVGFFNVVGCNVVVKSGGHQLLLKKPGNITSLNLRFDGDADLDSWERFLVAAAKQRRVKLSDFEILHPIGKGASGKVFLVRDRKTGEKLALKCIDKATMFKSRSAYRHAVDERLMLELALGQPFFIQLRYAFQTLQKVYLVTEFCEGGDLFYYLRTHGGFLNEDETRLLAAETVLAFEYMHGRGVVYRDLKPENVLLDRDGHLKLADFGLCKKLDVERDGGLTNTICGTHTYAAPEMLVIRQYGTSIDLWTLGVFIYHTLRGRTPYDGKDIDTVVQRMNSDPIRFPRGATNELIHLVTSLLERKPENRLGCGPRGVAELKAHPFFRDIDWKSVGQRANNPCQLKLNSSSASGEVPNFDLAEWRSVDLDEEEYNDDGRCDDYLLWPMQKVGRHSVMDFLLVGFTFDHEYAHACRRMMADGS